MSQAKVLSKDDIALAMTPYRDIALIPYLVATTVAGEVYTGKEFSDQLRDSRLVEETESKRQKMTPAEVEEFADLCDKRCERAYERQHEWFMRCHRSRTNAGRDALYNWIRHWLSSYLHNPDQFRKKVA